MIIFSPGTFAQSEFNNSKKMNLPPGSKLPSKFVFIDYSYKLNYISSTVKGNELPGIFFEDLSEEDLTEMKNNSPEKYQYYMDAEKFYNNLSKGVKSTFTTKELWYIYTYDIELTNKLLNIK